MTPMRPELAMDWTTEAAESVARWQFHVLIGMERSTGPTINLKQNEAQRARAESAHWQGS